MFQFLRPILESCKQAETTGVHARIIIQELHSIVTSFIHVGFEVLVGREKQLQTCKAMVLCATLDLPGKAKLLNFNQFNGEFGCSKCLQEGEVVAVGRGHTRVYPYLDTPAPLRSHAESYSLGMKALQTQKVLQARHSILLI